MKEFLKPILVGRIRRGAAHQLRALSEPARRRLSGIAPRSHKDYATHIPILIALAQHFRIQHVLELGCGDFSTVTFLNEHAFRDVARLDSFDNDHAWLMKIGERVGTDQRYCPRLVAGSIASMISQTPLDKFDLVFVDDSTSSEERSQTIRELSRQRPVNVLVVIHDFEVDEYRSAAAEFEHCHIFKAFTPQTGVVWNGNAAFSYLLKELELQTKRFAERIEPDDVAGWVRVFAQE